MNSIKIYDTTLRDGTQGEGFQLSVQDKLDVAKLIDDTGFHYIEGGWPGSNPRDEEFFQNAKKLTFTHARLTAFGSTRRAKLNCDTDPSIQALLKAEVPVITIFGKSSIFQSKEALRIEPEANLELIEDSIAYLAKRCDEVVFDGEHFFDAYKEDSEYALKVVQAAVRGGARWIVLCDTNGGSLPGEISATTQHVVQCINDTNISVGIHTHNDSELAVANTLASVQAGATMIQGTINGVGERCGNANLLSAVANLQLKLGYSCIPTEKLKSLTPLSRTVDNIANRQPAHHQAFTGKSAFAHKGGVHVSAIMRNPQCYEHIEPDVVGNARRILVSDLSGKSNILYKAEEMGAPLDPKSEATLTLLENIKKLEHEGYQFEGAEGSLRLLIEEARGEMKEFFTIKSAMVTSDLTTSHYDSLHPEDESSTATVCLFLDGKRMIGNARGNGPVHALDNAFRSLLVERFPNLNDTTLTDYKVRILQSTKSVSAKVRVMIHAKDDHQRWTTVGISANVIEASWKALNDLYRYKLLFCS